MIDLSFILDDPELGGVAFQILRKVYKRQSGEVADYFDTTIETTGNIQPARADQIAQLPEEYRNEEAIVVYSKVHMTLGENYGSWHTGADRIVWNNDEWRLVKVEPWMHQGIYSRGMAIKIRSVKVAPVPTPPVGGGS